MTECRQAVPKPNALASASPFAAPSAASGMAALDIRNGALLTLRFS